MARVECCQLYVFLILVSITVQSIRGVTTETNNDGIYCQSDHFEADCGSSGVVVIKSAVYGRMKLNRCATRNYGHMGCSADVSGHIHEKCSAKHSCRFLVFGEFDKLNQCPAEIAPYLRANFTCLKVLQINKNSCRGSRPLAVQSGYLATIDVQRTGAGTVSCPLRLRAEPGQHFRVYLMAFGSHSWQREAPCYELGTILAGNDRKTVSACDGHKIGMPLLVTSNNQLEMRLVSPAVLQSMGNFVFKYEVVGCVDLPPRPHTVMKRAGDKYTISCNSSSSSVTWSLFCRKSMWVGDDRNCTPSNEAESWSTISAFPYGILVIVTIGVAFGVFCGGMLLSLAAVYIKRNQPNITRHPETPHSQPGQIGDAGQTGQPRNTYCCDNVTDDTQFAAKSFTRDYDSNNSYLAGRGRSLDSGVVLYGKQKIPSRGRHLYEKPRFP